MPTGENSRAAAVANARGSSLVASSRSSLRSPRESLCGWRASSKSRRRSIGFSAYRWRRASSAIWTAAMTRNHGKLRAALNMVGGLPGDRSACTPLADGEPDEPDDGQRPGHEEVQPQPEHV